MPANKEGRYFRDAQVIKVEKVDFLAILAAKSVKKFADRCNSK